VGAIGNYKDVVILSTGIQENSYENLKRILYESVPAAQFICVDVANGYMEKLVYFVKRFREKYPRVILIAGNVVSAEMTESLILAGADMVKVGLGSGA